MLLSDKKIKEYVKEGKIMITPFEESQLGPSSYDLRLGFKFRVFRN
ncbi:MAG: deoxycytidine triphosphate deaminase, partial [Candidatus Aenigmatarchaeota archaeon]